MKFRKIHFVFIVIGIILLSFLVMLSARFIEGREAAHQSHTRSRLKFLSCWADNFKQSTGRSLFDVVSEFDLSWRVVLAKSYDDFDWQTNYKDFTKYKYYKTETQTVHVIFEHPTWPDPSEILTNFRAVKFSEGYLSKNKTRLHWIIAYIPSKPDVWTSKKILSQKEFEAEIAKPDSQAKFIVTEDQQVMTVKDFYELNRSVQE